MKILRVILALALGVSLASAQTTVSINSTTKQLMPTVPNIVVGNGQSITATGTGVIAASSVGSAPAGTLTGTTLAANVVTSSLTSVGTLTGGATGAGFTVGLGSSTITGALAGVNGGTGVANTGKTITIGGNVTTSGAYNLGFTLTGNTSLTLPTGGTVATVGGTGGLIPWRPLTTDQTYIAVGDSLTASYGVSNNYSYWMSFLPYWSGNGTVLNVGVGGYTIANITSDYAANVYPHRPTANGGDGGIRSTLGLEIGTNDIVTGRTDVNVIADLKTYITTAQTDGFTVVLMTIPPRRDPSWTPQDEAYRQSVNNSIRDGLIDTGTGFPIPTGGIFDLANVLNNPEDRSIFNTDLLHPLPAGTKAWAAALNAYFASNGSIRPLGGFISETSFTAPSVTSASITSASNPNRGLVLTGVAATKATSTLTGYTIGTRDFTVSFNAEIPNTVASGTLGAIAISSSSTNAVQARAFNTFYDAATGTMNFRLYGATTGDWLNYNCSMSDCGGQKANVVIERNGGVWSAYVNGSPRLLFATTNGSSPGAQGSITSTYLAVGYNSDSTVYVGSISNVAVYNFGLSSANVTNAYRNYAGGVEPKWLTNPSVAQATVLGPEDFSSTGSWLTGATYVIGGGVATYTNTPTTQGVGAFYIAPGGKSYVFSYNISSLTSGGIYVTVGSDASSVATTTGFRSFVTGAVTAGSAVGVVRAQNGAGTTSAIITYASLVEAGCIIYLPLNESQGTTAKDYSGNGFNASITGTGYAWAAVPNNTIGTTGYPLTLAGNAITLSALTGNGPVYTSGGIGTLNTGTTTGTGTTYVLSASPTFTGNILFTDNTYDIGANGATRPRTGYFGTSVISPLVTVSLANSNARLEQRITSNTFGISTNLTAAGTADNAGAPSWQLAFGSGEDLFRIQRAAAGSPGTLLTLLSVNPTSGGSLIVSGTAESVSASSASIGTLGGGYFTKKLITASTLTTLGGATFHTTSSALTDGAGAGAGTITNAPSAGNPTKWIGINDNGVTRFIPAWLWWGRAFRSEDF